MRGERPRPCKSRTIIVVWRTSPATCGRLSYPYKPSPAICGRLSYLYEHLLQLAGDLRTPTNISCNLRETFVPLRTISCNLRETIVPLQTSPAICGRPSYPYKHLLQLAGDLRTPTNISCNLRETFVPLRKSASAFFSLMICASYRKPYFCFIKIQYPEEIIRKYTQLSR